MVFRDFLCGSFNPKAIREEESNLQWKSPNIASTKPSKRSRIKSFFSSRRSKTPYPTAELDTRRQQQSIIYSQDREVTSVTKQQQQQRKKQFVEPDNVVILTCDSRNNLHVSSKAINEQLKERRVESSNGLGKKERTFFSSSKKMEPCWYLPAALVLILVLVGLFGKPFAVLCCSLFWHLVPALRGKELKVNE